MLKLGKVSYGGGELARRGIGMFGQHSTALYPCWWGPRRYFHLKKFIFKLITRLKKIIEKCKNYPKGERVTKNLASKKVLFSPKNEHFYPVPRQKLLLKIKITAKTMHYYKLFYLWSLEVQC